MKVWMVRAGGQGEDEEVALEEGLAIVGWRDLPDLGQVKTREDLYDLYKKTYPDASEGRINNHVGQLFMFVRRMQEGDIVALPLKSQPAIAIERVKVPTSS